MQPHTICIQYEGREFHNIPSQALKEPEINT